MSDTKNRKPDPAPDAADPKAPEVKAPEAVNDSHLVAMRKGGATLRVHPSCVAAHRAAGWVEA